MIHLRKLYYLPMVAISIISISITAFGQIESSDEKTPAEVVPAKAPKVVEAEKTEKVKEAKKVDLAVKYPSGKWVLKYNHSSESFTTIDGVGQVPQRISLDMILDLTIAIPNDAGLTGMELSIRQVDISVRNGSDEKKFTSANDGMSDRFLKSLFAPLMQVEITALLDSSGKCLEIKGIAGLWANVKEDNKRVMPMLKNIEKSLGDIITSSMTGQLLPEGLVSLGEKWTKTVKKSDGLSGSIQAKFDCTLSSLEAMEKRTLATVAFSGKLALDSTAAKTLTIGNASVKITSISGMQKGTMKIYTGTHIPAEYSCTQSAKIDMITSGITSGSKRQSKNVTVTRTSQSGWSLSKFESKPAKKDPK